MDQQVFETRQRAKEMLTEALAIWRNTPHSDELEGIEDDPIFSFLVMALAHQINRMDKNLDRVREEVTRDFVRALIPDSLVAPRPASLVIGCNTINEIDCVEMDDSRLFRIDGLPTAFRPILCTRVINLRVKSVTRIDGLQWKVRMGSNFPVTSLTGFAFALRCRGFEDLTVLLGDTELPLVKPWETYNLPVSPKFSTVASVYNKRMVYSAHTMCHELFALNEQRIFVVDQCRAGMLPPAGVQDLTLLFRFRNVADNFSFSASDLLLNAVVLANVDEHTVTLSADSPIARIGDTVSLADGRSLLTQFMHLTPPADEQQYEAMDVQVRRVRADRFDSLRLADLVQTLTDRLNTDYFAFQAMNNQMGNASLRRANLLLGSIARQLESQNAQKAAGVYLTIRPNSTAASPGVSVEYLTTAGASINDRLQGTPTVMPPQEIDVQSVALFGKPCLGQDAVSTHTDQLQLARYYMTTHDRIVTPADIRTYCMAELTARHGLGSFMVENISIARHRQKEWRESPYEISVRITLRDNRYLQLNFVDKIRQVEAELSHTIQARSVNIYPVRVEIEVME